MSGARADLVLVHGLGGAADYWDNLVEDLEADFRVTAVDLPGHGPGAVRPTPAEAVPRAMAAALLDQLGAAGLDRPHVVGLSLGGWVALEMAALGGAASVVALAPAGLWRQGATSPVGRRGTALRVCLRVADPLLPLLVRLPRFRRRALRSTLFDPSRASGAQVLAAARDLRRAKGFLVCDRAAVGHRFEAGAAVEVPTTVAFGDHDRVLPPESSQERSLLPAHAEWVVVPECGHSVSWDRPDVALELVRRTAARA